MSDAQDQEPVDPATYAVTHEGWVPEEDTAREVTPPRTYPLDEVVKTVRLLDDDGKPVTLQLIADGTVRWDRHA